MAAANAQKQQTTVVDNLRRADQRWARRNADQPAAPEYLEHLACSLQALVVPSNGNGDPSTSDAETSRLREQVVAAESNAAARRAELDQARAEIESIRGALESARRERDQVAEQLAEARSHTCDPADKTEHLRAQIGTLEADKAKSAKLIRELRADYDSLAADNQNIADKLAAAEAQRDSATDHRCVWQWHGPDEPIKPCICGRHAPRYELREVS